MFFSSGFPKFGLLLIPKSGTIMPNHFSMDDIDVQYAIVAGPILRNGPRTLVFENSNGTLKGIVKDICDAFRCPDASSCIDGCMSSSSFAKILNAFSSAGYVVESVVALPPSPDMPIDGVRGPEIAYTLKKTV